MQNREETVASGEVSGVVFDIQRYSIHDGPGIRTTVFLKGCPLECVWCQNPESQYREPEILLNRNSCKGCRQCVAVCPAGGNRLSGSFVVMDRESCVRCGKCVEACPYGARRLSGRLMSVGDVMKQVVKDRKFYETSGGGVTFSGGEATFQPRFLLDILKECKLKGFHTVLETCGYTSWRVLESVLEYIDLVLFDIKHVDPIKHQAGTGTRNDIILENASKVAESKPMKVRVPLIPGFNDREQDVRDIAAYVARLPNQIEMDLLAYNPLGEGKYERLGKERIEHKEVQSDAYVGALREIANAELKRSRFRVVGT